MKIVFFELEPEYESRIKKTFTDQEIYFCECPLTDSKLSSDYKDADAISIGICSLITKDIIEKFSHLKFIVSRTTGYDHIDIDYAHKKNIIVCNVPLYATISVAEHTFGLILALSRMLYESCYRAKQEHQFSCHSLTGFELYGKTIGIIGMGNIGKHVAKIAQGFGMNVLACDKCVMPEYGTFLSLEKLLAQSDIISIHVPLLQSTKHLINVENINLIKKGAYFINTARGGIVETLALVKGLQKGIFAGIGLDVLEDESFVKNPATFLLDSQATEEQLRIFALNQFLINDPRVIITPHNAFDSKESYARLIQETINTIRLWIQGKPISSIL